MALSASKLQPVKSINWHRQYSLEKRARIMTIHLFSGADRRYSRIIEATGNAKLSRWSVAMLLFLQQSIACRVRASSGAGELVTGMATQYRADLDDKNQYLKCCRRVEKKDVMDGYNIRLYVVEGNAMKE